MGTPTLSFVLPVYNERESLPTLHQKITETMASRRETFEMVFVDDGSSDGSMEVLAQLHQNDPRVRVVQFRRNFGKSAAYSAGFEHARVEFIITMDTDLQDDPAEIPLFLEKLRDGYDVVSGWKHEGKGALEKSLPSRFFNSVVRRATGINLHDFNCPFKAYRRDVVQEIHIYGELHRFIPVLAHSRGFSIVEIKIKNLPRQFGHSKFGIKRYLRGMLDLMTVLFITRFAQRPMHLLGLAGLVTTALGSVVLLFFLAADVLHRLNVLPGTEWDIHDRPALSLSILLMLIGVQFLTIGLLGELMERKNRTRISETPYSVKRFLGEQSAGPETTAEAADAPIIPLTGTSSAAAAP
jgi:glycosyltransferase involved in cell wall biosynthesis